VQTEHLEARAAASLLFRPRIGVIVPKYGRNIVDRNRVKRRLRELARTRLLPSAGTLDIIVRAKPGAYGTSFSQLAAEVAEIAKWIGGFVETSR
jgi:ribonuclease P protein component